MGDGGPAVPAGADSPPASPPAACWSVLEAVLTAQAGHAGRRAREGAAGRLASAAADGAFDLGAAVPYFNFSPSTLLEVAAWLTENAGAVREVHAVRIGALWGSDEDGAAARALAAALPAAAGEVDVGFFLAPAAASIAGVAAALLRRPPRAAAAAPPLLRAEPLAPDAAEGLAAELCRLFGGGDGGEGFVETRLVVELVGADWGEEGLAVTLDARASELALAGVSLRVDALDVVHVPPVPEHGAACVRVVRVQCDELKSAGEKEAEEVTEFIRLLPHMCDMVEFVGLDTRPGLGLDTDIVRAPQVRAAVAAALGNDAIVDVRADGVAGFADAAAHPPAASVAVERRGRRHGPPRAEFSLGGASRWEHELRGLHDALPLLPLLRQVVMRGWPMPHGGADPAAVAAALESVGAAVRAAVSPRHPLEAVLLLPECGLAGDDRAVLLRRPSWRPDPVGAGSTQRVLARELLWRTPCLAARLREVRTMLLAWRRARGAAPGAPGTPASAHAEPSAAAPPPAGAGQRRRRTSPLADLPRALVPGHAGHANACPATVLDFAVFVPDDPAWAERASDPGSSNSAGGATASSDADGVGPWIPAEPGGEAPRGGAAARSPRPRIPVGAAGAAPRSWGEVGQGYAGARADAPVATTESSSSAAAPTAAAADISTDEVHDLLRDSPGVPRAVADMLREEGVDGAALRLLRGAHLTELGVGDAGQRGAVLTARRTFLAAVSHSSGAQGTHPTSGSGGGAEGDPSSAEAGEPGFVAADDASLAAGSDDPSIRIGSAQGLSRSGESAVSSRSHEELLELDGLSERLACRGKIDRPTMSPCGIRGKPFRIRVGDVVFDNACEKCMGVVDRLVEHAGLRDGVRGTGTSILDRARMIHGRLYQALQNHASDIFTDQTRQLDDHAERKRWRRCQEIQRAIRDGKGEWEDWKKLEEVAIHVCELWPDEVNPNKHAKRKHHGHARCPLLCRDYALLVAPVCRRSGIEVRLLQGFSITGVPHAWVVAVTGAGHPVHDCAVIDCNKTAPYCEGFTQGLRPGGHLGDGRSRTTGTYVSGDGVGRDPDPAPTTAADAKEQRPVLQLQCVDGRDQQYPSCAGAAAREAG